MITPSVTMRPPYAQRSGGLVLIILAFGPLCTDAAPLVDPRAARPPATDGFCVSGRKKCGGGEWFHGPTSCCPETGLRCFKRHEFYSQCLPSCPLGLGWQCEASPRNASRPSPLTNDARSRTTDPGSCPSSRSVYSDRSSKKSTVCLFTHSDLARFESSAPRLLQSWSHEISWAVLLGFAGASGKLPVTRETAAPLFTFQALSDRGICPGNRHGEFASESRLRVTLVEGDGTVFFPEKKARYPFNMMRNVARAGCTVSADWHLMIDSDFEVFGSVHDILSHPKQLAARAAQVTTSYPQARKGGTTESSAAVPFVGVLPAFEVDSAVVVSWEKNHVVGKQRNWVSPPWATKAGLTELIRQGQARAFEASTWKKGHGPTDGTGKWLTPDQRPYEAKWAHGYEPYLIMAASEPVKFDEVFVGFGYDKVSFIEELHAAGRRFIVSPDLYVVHTNVHMHRSEAQELDEETQFVDKTPCATKGKSFDRNILGFSCLPEFYARLQHTYQGFTAPTFDGAFWSSVSTSAEECFGGCLTTTFPALKTHPPTLIVRPTLHESVPRSSLLLFHVHIPKTAGTTLSNYLVAAFCDEADSASTHGTHHVEKAVGDRGWGYHCKARCASAETAFARMNTVLESSGAGQSTAQAESLLLDTELACLEMPPSFPTKLQKRTEHALLDAELERASELSRVYRVQQVHFVVVLRLGSARLISHWSHCISEITQKTTSNICTLGGVMMAPFRSSGFELNSSESLTLWATNATSMRSGTYFRRDNQQVAILSSTSSRLPVNQAAFSRAQNALNDLVESGVMRFDKMVDSRRKILREGAYATVGFSECLSNLTGLLDRRFQQYVTPSWSASAAIALPHVEHRSAAGMVPSADARDAVARASRLDDALHLWALNAFPEAACDAGHHAHYRHVEPHCPPSQDDAAQPKPPLQALVITNHKTGTWMARTGVAEINSAVEKGCWDNPMPFLAMQDSGLILSNAMPTGCFAQIRRDPFEVVVSGYLYHRSGAEEWSKVSLQPTLEAAEKQRLKLEDAAKVAGLNAHSSSDDKRAARKEYFAGRNAPFGPWTSQFVRSTASLFEATHPSTGFLRGALPPPKYENGESYSDYLGRLTESQGLLAEALTAANITLPYMARLYDHVAKLKNGSGGDSACVATYCLSEFGPEPGECEAAWARLVGSVGFPLSSAASLGRSASTVACDTEGIDSSLSTKDHGVDTGQAARSHSSRGVAAAAHITYSPLPDLMRTLRRLDEQILGGLLQGFATRAPCPISRRYGA